MAKQGSIRQIADELEIECGRVELTINRFGTFTISINKLDNYEMNKSGNAVDDFYLTKDQVKEVIQFLEQVKE